MIRKSLLTLGLVAAFILPGITASPAGAETATVASSTSFGTLAQRNAYISCVAPGTEVGYTLRVKLLTYAGKALEGIRAGVPSSTITAGLRAQYHITSAEASKVYWCTLKVFA